MGGFLLSFLLTIGALRGNLGSFYQFFGISEEFDFRFVISIVFTFWLLYFISIKRPKFSIQAPVLIFFLGFGILAFGSIFWSFSISSNILKTLQYWFVLGPCCLGPFVLFSDPKLYRQQLYGIFFGVLFVGIGLMAKQLISFNRASGAAEDYITRGRIYSYSLLILLLPILSKGTAFLLKVFAFIAFITIFLLHITTSGRGPIIFWGLSFFIVVTGLVYLFFRGLLIYKSVHSSTIRFLHFSILILLILLASGTMLFFYNPDSFDFILTRFAAFLQPGAGTSASGRVELYSIAMNTIKENPFLGIGFGNFFTQVTLSPYQYTRIYPHNIFLEIASELGFLGLGMFWILLLWFIRASIKLLNTQSKKFPNFTFVFFVWTWISFLNAQTTGDLIDNRILFFAISSFLVFARMELRNEVKSKLSALN